MKKVFGILVMLVSLVAFSGYAQKPAVVTDNEPGWQKIGETSASFKMQNESIAVLGADEFSAIRIMVKDAPLNIERLQVFYESGDMEEIDLRSKLSVGSASRIITLKHPDRDIQKVAFTYKTVANAQGDKAGVELYGLKSGQPLGADSYRDEKKEIERDLDNAGEKAEREANEAADDTKSTAEKVGDNISEGVNDAAAAIADKKVEGKVGPGGETAYIDDDGKYYYINNEGNKVFITKIQLRDKPDDN
jgi:hypothetical protein